MPFNVNITPLGFQALGLMDSEEDRRKKEAQRRALALQQLAAPFAPDARVPQPIDLEGQPLNIDQTLAQSNAQRSGMAQPQFTQAAGELGVTGGQYLELIRSVEPGMREATDRALQQAKYNVTVLGEPIEAQPPNLIPTLREVYKIPDPNAPKPVPVAKNAQHAAELYLSGQYDDQQLNKALGLFDRAARAGKDPKPDTSAQDAEKKAEKAQTRLVGRLKAELEFARGNHAFIEKDKNGENVFNQAGLAEIARLQKEIIAAYRGDHPELQQSGQPGGQTTAPGQSGNRVTATMRPQAVPGELTPDEQAELNLRLMLKAQGGQ